MTTFETSQIDTHGIESARSLRLKVCLRRSRRNIATAALMRHTFRNVCTEANFGARIRYSDNVSGPLPTSTVVLPNCVHRPVHQVGISMPRDATDRPLPVSRSSSRAKFLNNCAVLGSATKMSKRVRHFGENSANALVDTSPYATRIGNLRHLPDFGRIRSGRLWGFSVRDRLGRGRSGRWSTGPRRPSGVAPPTP
jgi:hypothetical protein